MFQVNNTHNITTSTPVPIIFFNKVAGFQRLTLLKESLLTVLVSFCCHTFFSVSILAFGQLNICWDRDAAIYSCIQSMCFMQWRSMPSQTFFYVCFHFHFDLVHFLKAALDHFFHSVETYNLIWKPNELTCFFIFRRIAWVCLTILWGWHLKGYGNKYFNQINA